MDQATSKIQNRIIQVGHTLLQALRQMDRERVKLLFIFDEEQFAGLLSIGDIQRAIIRNLPLDSAVRSIMREDIILCYRDEPMQKVHDTMLRLRAECMPIVDRSSGALTDVIFWDDVFGSKKRLPGALDLPVVIMAGGKGTRLRPLTNIIPKPLIPIGDKSIIEVIIDKFRDHGVKDFYISANYKQDFIKFYFDSIEREYNVSYLVEKDFFGTAGSLSLLKDKVNTTFFVSNCDIIVENDYAEILEYHRSTGNAITIVASLKHYRIPYGTIESGEDGELISLQEKPELTYLINTGMYVLEPFVLDSIPAEKFYHITDLILDLKKQGKKVGVFPVSEQSWTDMGEWPEYRKLIEEYLNKQ